MTAKRESFWSRSDGERYMAAAEQAVADEAARQDGVDTARSLTAVWQSLREDERLLMEHLLMTGSTTVAALHNEGFVEALVDKGMLRRPPGVASVFMHYHETTYEVPPAVWRALNEQRQRFLPYAAAELQERARAAREHLKEKVQVFEPEGATRVTVSATPKPE